MGGGRLVRLSLTVQEGENDREQGGSCVCREKSSRSGIFF